MLGSPNQWTHPIRAIRYDSLRPATGKHSPFKLANRESNEQGASFNRLTHGFWGCTFKEPSTNCPCLNPVPRVADSHDDARDDQMRGTPLRAEGC